MHAYLLRRLLLIIPTLFGITVVVFGVMAAAPGSLSVDRLIDGQNLDPEARRALYDYYNRLYGLDDSAPEQYLRWLNNIMPIGFEIDDNGDYGAFSLTKGSNLGRSFHYSRPVSAILAERLPITLLLNLLSIPLIYLVSIALGLQTARNRGKTQDIAVNSFFLVLWSVPTILAGVLLISLLADRKYLNLFPTAGISSPQAFDMPFLPHWTHLGDAALVLALSFLGAVAGVMLTRALRSWAHRHNKFAPGALTATALAFAGAFLGIVAAQFFAQGEFIRGFLLDRLWHLVLPLICMTYGGFAFLTRLTRSSVLEEMGSLYARKARSIGLSENEVLWRHVFRNSLLPLITVSASLLPAMLAGSVIVESIFSIEGMGKLAVEAVRVRDRELVLSITLVSGLLTLAGYLLADIGYAIADPRVSLEEERPAA